MYAISGRERGRVRGIAATRGPSAVLYIRRYRLGLQTIRLLTDRRVCGDRRVPYGRIRYSPTADAYVSPVVARPIGRVLSIILIFVNYRTFSENPRETRSTRPDARNYGVRISFTDQPYGAFSDENTKIPS